MASGTIPNNKLLLTAAITTKIKDYFLTMPKESFCIAHFSQGVSDSPNVTASGICFIDKEDSSWGNFIAMANGNYYKASFQGSTASLTWSAL